MSFDPFSESNRRRDNPTVADRQKQAAGELQKRIDAASAPKPKPPVERPFVPSKPFGLP